LSRFGYFISKRALYLVTGWLCLFALQMGLASCTPEPVMGHAIRIYASPVEGIDSGVVRE